MEHCTVFGRPTVDSVEHCELDVPQQIDDRHPSILRSRIGVPW
jgi:hypothetical protein